MVHFELESAIELMKARYNCAVDPRFYFYRDVLGKEVDLLLQRGSHLTPIEIKSSKTFCSSFLNGLKYFHEQTPQKAEGGAIIYRGDLTQTLGNFQLLNAENCPSILL